MNFELRQKGVLPSFGNKGLADAERRRFNYKPLYRPTVDVREVFQHIDWKCIVEVPILGKNGW